MKTATLKTIETHCINTYGVTMYECDGTTALWVAEGLAKLGFDGYKVLKTISQKRRNIGRYTSFPEYGSPCLPTVQERPEIWANA